MEKNEIVGQAFVESVLADIPDDSLEHHGIKGMKWGRRRYQNKDGTLTAAGKKRYNEELTKLKEERKVLENRRKTQAAIDKLEKMRQENEEMKKSVSTKKSKTDDSSDDSSNETPKTKTTASNKTKSDTTKSDTTTRKRVEDMSDEELKNVVARIDNEKKYREAYPEKVSAGRKFVTDMLEKAVVPALQEVAKAELKNALTKIIKKAAEKDKLKHSELQHHGVKGQKWGVRRYQNKDGTLTAAGKKRVRKTTNKLADAADKYYNAINKYNALQDIGGDNSGMLKDIQKLHHNVDKLVAKAQKRLGPTSVVPTFEENGYVVKRVDAIVKMLDKEGRVASANVTAKPVETYNSWRNQKDSKGRKVADVISDINSTYEKKLRAAKTKAEEEEIMLDWDEAIEKYTFEDQYD